MIFRKSPQLPLHLPVVDITEPFPKVVVSTQTQLASTVKYSMLASSESSESPLPLENHNFQQTTPEQHAMVPLTAQETNDQVKTSNIKFNQNNTILKKLISIDVQLIREALPFLLLAMCGLILAGSLLDTVQHWNIFNEVSELIILIPVILNLKGNLEMNLAARLSTAANLDLFERFEDRNEILVGNLLLMQVQGIVVGAIGGFFSFFLGMLIHGTMDTFEETTLMLASGMITSSISSFLLGSFMCLIVVVSKVYNVNPDNISTPIAASLGDLITLSILTAAAYIFKTANLAFDFVAITIMLAILPVVFAFVYRNKHVSHLLYQGWSSLIGSMVISSIAGVILERYISKFAGMAVLSPVMNGLTGNLAAIYVSRMATAMYGQEPEDYFSIKSSLFLMNIPIQVVVLLILFVFDMGHTELNLAFIVTYLFVSCVVVGLVLHFTEHFCVWLWKHDFDPHQHALPYVTSTTDVFGTLTLIICFQILNYLGKK